MGKTEISVQAMVFLGRTTKAQNKKVKDDKQDYINFLSLYIEKEAMNTEKRHPLQWQNISHRGLLSSLYKELKLI